MGHVPICAYTLLGGSKGHRVGFRKTRNESVRQHAMDIPAIPELSRRVFRGRGRPSGVRVRFAGRRRASTRRRRATPPTRRRWCTTRPGTTHRTFLCGLLPAPLGYYPHAWHSASSRGHRGGRALRITGAYSTGLLILSQVTYECLYVFRGSTKSFLRA